VETVVRLNEDANLLLMYLESCMKAVAPNLCQLLGSLVASRLISLAGGVKELAAIPACNIQVMGGQRAGQVGLNVGDRNHTGVFGQMDIVRDAPQEYRMNLVRMFASNTAKCVRADLLKSQSGLGSRLREELYERFEKIQE
jgi:U4/U6 small nuclear ribonucleoprotein PRP31